MLNITPNALRLTPCELTGAFLAKNRLSPRARARLAAAILSQQIVLTRLTVKQIAELCRVSVGMVNAARGGGHRKPADLALARAWAKATPQEQIEFVKHAGPEAVWTALIAAI
jgi:hypothetical protein